MTDNPLSTNEALALANLLLRVKQPVMIRAFYTNHRGEGAERWFTPKRIHYGTTEYYPEPCLLLDVWDIDKQAARTYRIDQFDHRTIRRA